jgi:exonuclease SbcD
MRLLHTADWHLGRTLGGYALLEDQAHLLLGQFLDLVRETAPDAVLISGDLFDRAVPPAEAVELLDDVLGRIVLGMKVPVVMIPGNHDDARRLSFGARLLAGAGLHIGDSPLGRAVTLADAHGPVSIVAAGYASPLALAQLAANGADFADHDAGFAWVAPLLLGLCPPGHRRVLVAHAFVAGGTESESERTLSVGGTGQIGAHRFAGFDYVALGHLHRPHTLGAGRLRYSGSPLAYSLSEIDHAKSVTLAEVGADGAVRIEEHALTPLRPLRQLEGSFAALRDAPPDGRGDWLSIVLTDPVPVPEAQRRLSEVYPRMVGLRHAAVAAPGGAIVTPAATARAATPLDLFTTFHRAVRGRDLPEAAEPVLHAAIAAAHSVDR